MSGADGTREVRPGDRVTGITGRVDRKLRARRRGRPGVYFGLGMFGLIGWAVAVPTVAGIALGVWVDAQWPSRYSWTLMLLFAGMSLGCWNAWHWMQREGRVPRNGDEGEAP